MNERRVAKINNTLENGQLTRFAGAFGWLLRREHYESMARENILLCFLCRPFCRMSPVTVICFFKGKPHQRLKEMTVRFGRCAVWPAFKRTALGL
ncbi:hypothetical protein EFK13_12045 [Bacillus cabrialesii]|uniref:hypothetical protein n=1 Tax=Bacillus cabrialesii TaxID=2487276 RepID=UPI0010101CA5|nr:hypothetical protein [Bacillus cabrialesii]UQE77521.1 hypothetical protein EFK13_12045 [Bacillus cabrialesii]